MVITKAYYNVSVLNDYIDSNMDINIDAIERLLPSPCPRAILPAFALYVHVISWLFYAAGCALGGSPQEVEQRLGPSMPSAFQRRGLSPTNHQPTATAQRRERPDSRDRSSATSNARRLKQRTSGSSLGVLGPRTSRLLCMNLMQTTATHT